jgi:arylsulfatase A-like enzyme
MAYNIVVCTCDQLRAFETGCYGNAAIRTPNLDRLASQGVRFETAVSNNPVCMAARSALLSGQHSRTCNGHLGNDYVSTGGKGWSTLEPEFPERQRGAHLPGTTLPEALGQAGYHCATVGKWHIRPAPEAVGFHHSVLPLNNHRHTGQRFSVDGAEPIPVEGFSVDHEIETVENFLADRRNNDKPFFLYYNIMPPHMPLGDMPSRYLDMYPPDQLPLRPNVEINDNLPVSDEWFKVYLWDYAYYHHREPHTLDLPADFDIRALTALYYGAVTWVDDMAGRLLAALEDNGLDRDTIVVFTSDHGDQLGSHHRWNKGTLLEESIRVPLLWRCPDRWPSAVNHQQVASLIDIMPTVLDACGLEVPACVQGQSLLPLLNGQRTSLERAWSFIETNADETEDGLATIGIRTASHLYGMRLDPQSHNLVDTEFCFYDLERDPYELDNLAGTAHTLGIGKELKRRLLNWHQRIPWLDHPDRGPERTRLFDEDGIPRR